MKTDYFNEKAQYYPPLSIVGVYNNWIDLNAGGVRFFEFYNQHRVFWFFKVGASQPLGNLATGQALRNLQYPSRRVQKIHIAFSIEHK